MVVGSSVFTTADSFGQQILVKTLTGKTISIDAELSGGVESLKQRVFEKTEIPSDQRRLIFAESRGCAQ